jgi:hypothetical protein
MNAAQQLVKTMLYYGYKHGKNTGEYLATVSPRRA